MASVSKEKKAKIAAKLKGIVPKSWKYSLAVDHGTSIVMMIYSTPVDLIAHINETFKENQNNRHTEITDKHFQVNHYHPKNQFRGEVLETMEKIIEALNTDNFDHSDSMTDFFHVGHYVNLNIGRWNKDYEVCK